MKHAKGPWTLKWESEHENEYSIYEGDQHLLNIHSANSEIAPLVAAAPEMLEALQKIQVLLMEKHLGQENHVHELLIIGKAIAKARGES